MEITSKIAGKAEEHKAPRSVFNAMLRGALLRCPNCGEGRLFRRYLKVADHCPVCHEALHHHRADDAPPYFTTFIAGHLLVPLLIAFEVAFRPALWIHALVWVPVTLAHQQFRLGPACIDDEQRRRIARPHIGEALGFEFLGQIAPPDGGRARIIAVNGHHLIIAFARTIQRLRP